jgi:DNA end-binding protein Ku
MPARSIASATISFGLVSVPVNLYSSSESKTSVSFNMLHKKCNTRLKQQYICQKDNEIVGREDTVKGYEFAKDQYVVFTPEELKALEEKATGMIEVIEFVPLPGAAGYLEKVYYLGPERAAMYRLLYRTRRPGAPLGRAGTRAAYLILLRPYNSCLVMEQLHYADEIATAEGRSPRGEMKPGELARAKQLIDQTANDNFEPQKYKDTVRERVLETIQRKVDGQDITSSDVVPDSGGKIVDLMEALKASLARTEEEAPARKVS